MIVDKISVDDAVDCLEKLISCVDNITAPTGSCDMKCSLCELY